MSSETTTVIEAGAICTPSEVHRPGRLLVQDGRIADVGTTASVETPPGAEWHRFPQHTIVPGFLDSHVHGCAGLDVMDATDVSLSRITSGLIRSGTTTFLATTVSAPVDFLTGVIDRLGRCDSVGPGRRAAGIHLEGPFISRERRGTHPEASIAAPDANVFGKWVALGRGKLKLITVAPELEGVGDLMEAARRAGVRVGLGHSNANFEEARAAIDRGACYAVHTFNAMRPMTHRDPAITGAVLDDDRVYAEIIADGWHVDPAVVRLFARLKGSDRTLLITDGISATGMPDGIYRLGDFDVHVSGGICRSSDGRLAGSTLTQDRALRNFIEWTGWQIADAVKGMTTNVAEAVGLDGRGVLKAGADADFVVLDGSLRVFATYVQGQAVKP